MKTTLIGNIGVILFLTLFSGCGIQDRLLNGGIIGTGGTTSTQGGNSSGYSPGSTSGSSSGGGVVAVVTSDNCTPAVIDFEHGEDPSQPINLKMGDGTPLTVTLHSLSGYSFTVPDVRKEGSDHYGFHYDAGSVWNVPISYFAPLVGNFFLSFDGIIVGQRTSMDVEIDLSTPIEAFSTDILDIDGDEGWKVSVLDASGSVLNSQTVTSLDTDSAYPSPNGAGWGGDGTAYTVQVGAKTAFSTIDIHGFWQDRGADGYAGFGFGFDRLGFSNCAGAYIIRAQDFVSGSDVHANGQ